MFVRKERLEGRTVRLQRSLRARTRKSDEWTTRVALRGCARAGKGGSRELIERQGPRALYTTGGVDGSRVPSDRPAVRRRFLTGFAPLRVPVPGQKWSVQARNGARRPRMARGGIQARCRPATAERGAGARAPWRGGSRLDRRESQVACEMNDITAMTTSSGRTTAKCKFNVVGASCCAAGPTR